MLSSMIRGSKATLTVAAFAGLSAFAGGCLDRELKPLNPCLVSGVVDKISVQNVDKVDLLFVVDNSGSMREEQAALRVQFPRLITTLTRGERADGTTFPAVRDLHLGVVSTDMGLPGVQGRANLGCGDDSRLFGDDGVLRNAPNPGGAPNVACQPGYSEAFLRFTITNDPQENERRATQIANDFSCISSLGTAGCGFEMQLESALRALWPSDNIMPNGMPGRFADNLPFLDGTASGKGGPGNPANPAGPNTGFLRNNVQDGLSLIAVVFVSDEEDCSSHRTDHFIPEQFLPDGHPLKPIGLNMRCFDQSMRSGGEDRRDQGLGNLYSTARYAQGLKALRPGNENLVIFAAIVGVPTDLVDPARLAGIDFTNEASRNGFYDSLLADNRLVEVGDPANAGTANPNLTPSCIRPAIDPVTGQQQIDSMGNPVNQRAFPPRRFIKVAKEFGENATIQSICSDDFTPAVNQIIDIIARQLGSVCLPRQLTADAEGRVACDVVWELPRVGEAQSGTPTSCEERMGLLSRPAADRAQTSAEGRTLCVVNQVPVEPCTVGPGDPNCVNGQRPNRTPGSDSTGAPRHVDGWYYDDFSAEIANCPAVNKQRIAFTNNNIDAQPPSGVTVRLECLQEAASLTVPRTDIANIPNQPSLGTGCDIDPDCHIQLATPQTCIEERDYRSPRPFDGSVCRDVQMFCHPQQKICVAGCQDRSECLPGFECDNRPNTLMGTGPDPITGGPRAICVNPTCGE